MSDPIISIQNVGKCYRLRHEANTPYRMLRETLALKARGFAAGQILSSPRATEEPFWALRDVNIDIQRGDAVGVIGRNGAGKSTLLKILSRITEPTTGRIRLRGRVASLLEVGTGFHPELTGRENIYLNGAILGMAKAEIRSRFDEIVAFAEVERFLDTPVKHYSSGMYVRLAFAVAAHLEPEILVIDEVLAVGDAQFRSKCLTKMDDVASQNRTLIFVSHDLAAVQKLTKSAILLDRGTVAAYGPTAQCAAQYLASCNTNCSSLSLPASPNKDFRFLRIEILNVEHGPIRSITLRQPFVVKVTLSADAPFRDSIVGIGFHTTDGTPLFATHTNDFGDALDVCPGETTAYCRVDPNYLRPGNYYLSLGFISRKQLIQHVPQACSLTIERLMHSGADVYDDRAGLLFIPMRWDVAHSPMIPCSD